jgi:hypothetical protein
MVHYFYYNTFAPKRQLPVAMPVTAVKNGREREHYLRGNCFASCHPRYRVYLRRSVDQLGKLSGADTTNNSEDFTTDNSEDDKLR